MTISIVTLRLLQFRIESLKNKGQDICNSFEPDKSSSFNSISCNKCGYSSDLHLLRDIYKDLK